MQVLRDMAEQDLRGCGEGEVPITSTISDAEAGPCIRARDRASRETRIIDSKRQRQSHRSGGKISQVRQVPQRGEDGEQQASCAPQTVPTAMESVELQTGNEVRAGAADIELPSDDVQEMTATLHVYIVASHRPRPRQS